MNKRDWKIRFDKEVDRGRRARQEGNEGMARVCARRAAGLVVRAYYEERGKPLPGVSVLKHLRELYEADDEPEDVKTVARNFTLQITPDHILPGNVDLIENVLWLEKTLFPDK